MTRFVPDISFNVWCSPFSLTFKNKSQLIFVSSFSSQLMILKIMNLKKIRKFFYRSKHFFACVVAYNTIQRNLIAKKVSVSTKPSIKFDVISLQVPINHRFPKTTTKQNLGRRVNNNGTITRETKLYIKDFIMALGAAATGLVNEG